MRCLTLSLLLLSAAQAERGPGIDWCKDLATAQAQSARDNRPVLLYFTFET